jgi:hypothetical protein
MVQSTSVNDPQDRDAVSLVPEWPRAVEAPSGGFKNDGLVSGRPSIVRRMFRTLARFFIAVLIGVCATLAWQSHGDQAKEVVSTWVPALRWLFPVSTTISPSDGLGSAQDVALPVPQRTTPAAAVTPPELAQLDPMARDLAAMRRSLDQLAAKQEEMAQNVARLEAAEQDIRKKMSSSPLSQAVPIPPRKPQRPTAPAVQSSPASTPPPVGQPPSQTRSGQP